MTSSLSARCHCGSVHIELHGRPAARAFCHCQACRDFYATPILAATAWPADAVRLRGDTATFAHPVRQMSRSFCTECGETLFGTNRLGMRVVPNSILARAAGGILPADLHPTMHLFYRHRTVDVLDGLTKYLDGWDGPEYQSGSAPPDA